MQPCKHPAACGWLHLQSVPICRNFSFHFIGGVWADRYHRKKIDYRRRSADCIGHFRNGIGNSAYFHRSLLCSAVCLLCRSYDPWGAGIQTPAVNAVIPQLVPEDQLMRYNGINATMQSIVNFCGSSGGRCSFFAISTLRMTLMIDICNGDLGNGPIVLLGASETKYFH